MGIAEETKMIIDIIDEVTSRIQLTQEQEEARLNREAKMAARRSAPRRIGANKR